MAQEYGNLSSLEHYTSLAAQTYFACYDCNEFTTPGLYYCGYGDYNNGPTTNMQGWFFVYRSGGGYVCQFYVNASSDNAYLRAYTEETWSNWKRIIWVQSASATVGSSSTPIYLNNGVPTACTGITTRQFTFTASISANSKYYSDSLDVSYSGHTPIGVVGITVYAANADVAPVEWAVRSSGVLTLGIMNNTSSAQSITIYVTVLYM